MRSEPDLRADVPARRRGTTTGGDDLDDADDLRRVPLSHLIGGLRLSGLGRTDDPHALWWPLVVAITALSVAVLVARRRAD